MQEDFTITGTPTGFSDGNVILTGYFEYNWDTEREKLIDRQIIILNMDRTEFTDTTGIKYKFTNQAVDRSRIDALSILVNFLAIVNVARVIANRSLSVCHCSVESKRGILEV